MPKKSTPGKPVEKRKEPAKARGKEAPYEDIVERSMDGIAIVQDNIVSYANRRLAEMWGGSVEEILGSALSNHIHPGDRPETLDRYARRVAGEPVPPTYEIRLLRKNGQTIWADVSGAMVLYEGRPADLLFIRDVDERKQAEAALRASEGKYRLHFEYASDVIYALDTELRVVSVSPSVEKTLGYKPDEIIGKTFPEMNILSPASLAKAFSDISRVLAGETIASSVYEFITRDGQTGIGEVSGTPLLRDGKIIGLVSVARDITDRRRSDQALAAGMAELEESRKRAQESSAVLMAILESPPDVVIFALDEGCRYLAFNSGHKLTMKAIWGVDIEIGVNMLDYIGNAADREKARLNFDRALRGEAFAIIEEYGDVELQRRYYEDRYAPIRGEDGAVVGLTVFLTDITERKQAEEKNRSLAVRQEALLAAVPEIIMEVDLNKVYAWANPAGLEFFGGDVVGNEAALYFEGEQDTYTRVRPIFNGQEETVYIESRQRRKDGQKRLLAWWCRPLKDAQGNVTGALSSARDITDRKLAEAKVLSSLREKEVLLKELHHRVKNNMQVISSLLSLQAQTTGNPEVAVVLKETQRRIRSMALVHEKLYQSGTLSRIEFDDYLVSLGTQLFQFNDIASSRIELVTGLEKILLDIRSAIPCGLIVNELLSNALKHAFPGNRKGRIEIELRSLPDDRILLRIKDDGVGLPERLDIQKTKTLGLQIVTSLISQIDGELEILREGGTEFRIVFKEAKHQTQP